MGAQPFKPVSKQRVDRRYMLHGDLGDHCAVGCAEEIRLCQDTTVLLGRGGPRGDEQLTINILSVYSGHKRIPCQLPTLRRGIGGRGQWIGIQ
jgi:hypothetical protein